MEKCRYVHIQKKSILLTAVSNGRIWNWLFLKKLMLFIWWCLILLERKLPLIVKKKLCWRICGDVFRVFRSQNQRKQLLTGLFFKRGPTWKQSGSGLVKDMPEALWNYFPLRINTNIHNRKRLGVTGLFSFGLNYILSLKILYRKEWRYLNMG